MNNTPDSLQRFLINRAHVRGVLVKLQQSYLTIISQQHYPETIAHLLGETLVTSALLTSTIKFQGTLIMQLQNQGPLELLVAHCNQQLHIRGVAKWREDEEDFSDALEGGTLAITIAPDEGERYQGIVQLETNELAKAVETYFDQSEQLSTLIVLAADQHAAAGLLLQKLPNHLFDTADADNWADLETQLKQLYTHELLNLDNETILNRLFPDEDVIVYDPEPVVFRCTCTEERSANAIRTLEQADIDELLGIYKEITVTCEFCHHSYRFDADKVIAIKQTAN
ncbi:MAG: hslO [Gammaproteobacteria bacterium]|jgi:molecular chaperone Hsp33|nr:hslO [Gammaproteobacteria bacterium]